MKRLYNEYINLSNSSSKFRENQDFSVETLINRYYEGGLDTARDYLYFKDDSYEITPIKLPKIKRFYESSVPPKRADELDQKIESYAKSIITIKNGSNMIVPHF